MEDGAIDRLAIKLASVTRVEAHKRRGAKGQTEHVDSYLRKVLDSFGGPNAKTKRGYYTRPVEPAPPPKPVYKPLTRDQFSDPETPRTRAVSSAEFQELAAKGQSRLAAFHDHASPPTGLDKHWQAVKDQAWASVQDEWGGVTIDAHTGQNVTGEPNKYALTARPNGVYSVTMPVGSDRDTFDKAMDDARQRFDSVLSNEHYHLGVFRDDAIDRIDIDPVLVLDDHDDVESIGAYTHAEGGAYNFSDGLGYWPPYVDKGLDNAGRQGSAVQGAGSVVRTGQEGRGPP